MIELYLRGGHTMGDTLMAMCLFNTVDQPVHIITGTDSWYITWKQILDIGDRVTVTTANDHELWLNPPHPSYLESMKPFSRYDQFDHVRLFGQSFPVGRSGKKCAGIFINNGNDVKNAKFFERLDSIHRDEYPYYKFHGSRVYSHIIDLVQSAGYDPLIIDNKDISTEHKVFMLNELCDFVVGYEGGMCHVAHALKIPTVMLPLRVASGPYYHTDFLHLDRRTYFIRDVKELLAWSPEELLAVVDRLRNEGGNNQWLTTTDPTAFVNHFRAGSGPEFNSRLDWVLENMTNPALGGY